MRTFEVRLKDAANVDIEAEYLMVSAEAVTFTKGTNDIVAVVPLSTLIYVREKSK